MLIKLALCTTFQIAYFFGLFFFLLGWGETVPLVHRSLIALLWQPQMTGEYEEYGTEIEKLGKTSVPLCPPQIPHHMTW
jgi:hypothetical protein